jgi:hypothetical protein
MWLFSSSYNGFEYWNLNVFQIKLSIDFVDFTSIMWYNFTTINLKGMMNMYNKNYYV